MKIAVDAMGGDNAPKEIILGAIHACDQYGLNLILVGRETDIKVHLTNPRRGSIEIIHADEIITNDDSPVMSIRRKRNSSIVKGIELVKDKKAAAFVSAGSTGALTAGSLLLLGRFEGIDRPAISSVLPTLQSPSLLLDIGANSDVKPKNLVQFALMGAIYAKEVMGRSNPKVGLLNIGQEKEKGNSVIKSAYSAISEIEDINFVGNVEARSFFEGGADVVVCDGFTGNIFIKTIEGFGNYLFHSLKQELRSKITYSLGGTLISPAIKNVKAQLDYSDYGGAMLLGLNGLVVKAHGSSKSKAISNAIKVCAQSHKAGIQERIRASLKTCSPDLGKVE